MCIYIYIYIYVYIYIYIYIYTHMYMRYTCIRRDLLGDLPDRGARGEGRANHQLATQTYNTLIVHLNMQ